MAVSFSSSSLRMVVSIVLISTNNRSFAFAFRHHPTTTCNGLPLLSNLCPRMHMTIGNYDNISNNKEMENIRYLGAGDNAIIRPGVVLVAPTHEYDHFLMKSAVFIYAIGLDDEDNTIVRGVVLDHPTAFTIGEMSPNVMGALSENRIFRGGYDGRDTAMLLHSAGGPDGPVKSDTPIGLSSIYEGGIVSAMEAADAGSIDLNSCKFFFNYMQFTGAQLDNMFGGVEDGDTWVSLEIPPDYILNSDYDRGQLWSKLRNSIREIQLESRHINE